MVKITVVQFKQLRTTTPRVELGEDFRLGVVVGEAEAEVVLEVVLEVVPEVIQFEEAREVEEEVEEEEVSSVGTQLSLNIKR